MWPASHDQSEVPCGLRCQWFLATQLTDLRKREHLWELYAALPPAERTDVNRLAAELSREADLPDAITRTYLAEFATDTGALPPRPVIQAKALPQSPYEKLAAERAPRSPRGRLTGELPRVADIAADHDVFFGTPSASSLSSRTKASSPVPRTARSRGHAIRYGVVGTWETRGVGVGVTHVHTGLRAPADLRSCGCWNRVGIAYAPRGTLGWERHPWTEEDQATDPHTESAARLRTHGARRRAEERPLLTVAETARMLRVSEMTVRRACDAGEMPAIRMGRTRRIPRKFVQCLLDDAADGASIALTTTDATAGKSTRGC